MCIERVLKQQKINGLQSIKVQWKKEEEINWIKFEEKNESQF